MKYLVTGSAGFIGFFVAKRLLEDGAEVVGLDNLNDYYEPALKKSRLALLKKYPAFQFVKADLKNRKRMESLFAEQQFDRVIHLAAQAGVRYSLQNPHAYGDSNLTGFLHILEGCRQTGVKHLIFASSSSVYGANTNQPFSVHDNVDHPISLYAATKKANELMAHVYAHLYNIPCTGLRFFTVYGPWGRPDMAPMIFTRKILAGEPIDVFNHGQMKRDFTYIDDIVEGVIRAANLIPSENLQWDRNHPDPGTSFAPYRVFNIGNNQPVELMHFIETLERALGKTAEKNFLPMQPGDVHETCANVDDLQRETGYAPSTPLEDGIGRFIDWYGKYYKTALNK